jgi:hypothetical protein
MQPEQVDEDVHLRSEYDTCGNTAIAWHSNMCNGYTASKRLFATASSNARHTADCSASTNRQWPHYSGSTIDHSRSIYSAAHRIVQPARLQW